jgi:hypothetical protein
MTETEREAALRPDAVSLYPYLPARMWTGAERIANLVMSYRGIWDWTTDRANRVLSDAHFVFRDRALGQVKR